MPVINLTAQNPVNKLPNDYQLVEYIYSTGTQYIDTGVASSHGNKFETSIYGDIPGGSLYIVSQGHNSLRQMSYNVVRWFTKNRNIYGSLIANEYNKVEFGENYLRINGVDGTPTNDSDNAVGIVRLFCNNLNTTQCAIVKMAYCKIWDSSNSLVRFLLPCYRKSDDVIGMYDIVNGVFYTNDGTGDFQKGPNI